MKKKPIIIAKNIHRKFGTGALEAHILKGIDMEVAEGEFVAIMGKSGAGKSTLMYQLSLLDEPTDGSILIDTEDPLTLSENERTRFRLNTLGYVFQDYALVPDLSARENVMMPLLMRGVDWATAAAIADRSLDDVGLPNKYTNLPSELSGGEQQRTAVARAIAGNPKILFADEPTANLDSVSGGVVIDLLTALHKSGQTIVMVTHEPEYAENCDRIIYMEDGVIVRQGKPRKPKTAAKEKAKTKPMAKKTKQNKLKTANITKSTVRKKAATNAKQATKKITPKHSKRKITAK